MPCTYKISALNFSLLIVLLCAQLVSQPAVADDLSISPPYIPNLINLEYGGDSDEGRDFFLFTSLSFAPGHRLSLSYGNRDETVRDTLEALDTSTYAAGYAYHSFRKYRLGIDIEHWGDEDKVTTDTGSVFLALDLHDFTFTLSPQYRQIEIFTDTTCSGSIDNTALAVDVKYYPNKFLGFSAAYVTFDYSKERDALLGCAESEDIPFLVGRLKSVADDNQLLLGVNFFWNTETYALDWVRVESAIDGDTTYIMTAYIATDWFDEWTLGLTVGTQDNYDDTTTNFVKGAITYYW
jgi:hypothetical protein